MRFVIYLCAAALILVITGFVEAKLLTVRTYKISGRVPEILDGYKLLVLSDLHCTRFGKGNKRLYDAIRRCDPDMVVIPGDLINGHKTSDFKYAEDLFGMLKTLHIPVYYTFGNHEEYLHTDRSSEYEAYAEYSRRHVTLLNDSTLRIPEQGIAISGTVLPDGSDRGEIADWLPIVASKRLFEGTHFHDYRILIAHDPAFISGYLKSRPDLVISGHVHGGIIRLPFVGGLLSPRRKFFPRPDKGLFIYGNTRLIVSGGVGWHGIPIRLFNRPELVMINFTYKGKRNESGSQT